MIISTVWLSLKTAVIVYTTTIEWAVTLSYIIQEWTDDSQEHPRSNPSPT